MDDGGVSITNEQKRCKVHRVYLAMSLSDVDSSG